MSNFLYIHKDMSGDPAWNKVGISITPYSAVRSRQKNCSQEFTLDHLYFGRAVHIERLEYLLKDTYKNFTGKVITGRGQTELFNLTQDQLVKIIDENIVKKEFDIIKMELKNPYRASKASDCPFDVPSESAVAPWAKKLVLETWGESEEEKFVKNLWKGTPFENS
jgi:hypothetical protein